MTGADGRRPTPCGSWPSAIAAEHIAAGGRRLAQPQVDGDAVYWVETRPDEKGRTVLVRRNGDGTVRDLVPPPFSVRSRVHEYGGGAYRAAGGRTWFVNNEDQGIWEVGADGQPDHLVGAEGLRFADLWLDSARDRLIAVCEDHRAGGEPANRLVAVNLSDGHMQTLAEDSDFVSSPRVSPDGSRLSWLAWDHPRLPWNGTSLRVATIGPDGQPDEGITVAGGTDQSVFQPEWGPDGRLYYVCDQSNWWNLYAWDGTSVAALTALEAEFGQPQWVFGQSNYAFVGPTRLLCAATADGLWRTYELDLETGRLHAADTGLDAVEHVAANERMAALLAGSAERSPGIYLSAMNGDGWRLVARSHDADPDPGYLAPPETVTFPTTDGDVAHGLFYAPAHPECRPADGERPPLIVQCHGGPTGATSTALDLKLRYWTSRGFAVLDLNYRGSTGYGREFREKLHGAWGVADVADCVAGARYLAEAGHVDAGRVLISGGSAGGYAVLCALAFTDAFRAGASYYGIGDLESMFATTHKFESRYDWWLIGRLPEAKDVYRARSPLQHADRIDCPVIFFQGGKDRVVPPDQSQAMVAALRDRGVPVAYIEFPDEAHGFRQADSIRRSLDAELFFYGRVLGFEPADVTEAVAIENAGRLDN